MTAAEGSLLGLAIQSAAGTPETRDAQFKYLLYNEAQVAPNNVNLPLDPEVGGGALMRSVVKVAVNSGGAIGLVPRPETLGFFLLGMTGNVTTTRNHRADAVLAAHALDGSTLLVAGGLIHQPSIPTKFTVKASGAATGNVVITCTVGGVAGQTITIALNGATVVESADLGSVITQIVLPTVADTTVEIGWYDGSYTHVFKLDDTDHFAAPYWTVRNQLAVGKGNAWGEQFEDVRINMLGLEFRAPGFMRGTTQMVGGKAGGVASTTWNALDYVDSGPQFITSPGPKIQLPSGSALSVLGGSFAAASAIPLDEQYVVGSYFPEGLEIVNRQFGITLNVKLPDEALYKKMMYDPAGGNDWAAEIFREARLLFQMYSDQDAASVKLSTETADVRPYSFKVEGNGQQGDDANIVWTMAPVGTRAQRQITAQLTGTFLASPNAVYDPITITLVNRRASYAYVAP